MIEMEQEVNVNPTKVKVLGIGGGGGNVIDRMIDENIVGLDFIAINTDLQTLSRSKANTKIQIGIELTKGLGAGATPDIGRQAAEESLDEIKDVLDGSNMVFITAGMGGGTGTGASPVIASLAKKMGILTVAVITKPFDFEGIKRMKHAMKGIEELKNSIDTLITVPNENLLRIFGDNATVLECFRQADKVLMQGVKAISELVVLPGVINVDFSDLCTVMQNRGSSIMGMADTTIGKGGFSPEELAKVVVENPLLEKTDISGAKGILINIKNGKNIPLSFVNDFSKYISQKANVDADIVVGVVLDDENDDKITVTLIATGIGEDVSSNGEMNDFTDTFSHPKPITEEIPLGRNVEDKEDKILEEDVSLKEEVFDENEEKIIDKPYFGKGEYIDIQNIDVPTFLRRKKK